MTIFSVHNQSEPENDVERRNLKGNVKSYKESVFNRRYDEGTNDMKGKLLQISTHEVHFNSLGKIMEENIHNTEENFSSRTCYLYDDESGYRTKTEHTRYNRAISYQERFDNKGNQIESKTYLKNGTLLSTTNNRYNKNGIIAETKTTYTDKGKEFYNSSLRESRVFTYDSIGNNTEEIVYDAHGPLRAKIVYIYDQSANLIEMQMLDSGNKLLRKEMYEYDSQGNKIVEQEEGGYKLVHQYDATGKKTVSEFSKEDYMSYEYNEDGLLEKEKHYRKHITNAKLLNTIVYKYNKARQLIEEYETDLTWGKSERRLYQYDERGNRIEKKWIKNIGDGDFEEIWSATYDEKGNKLKEVLKADNRTYFEVYLYDENGRKIKTEQYESYLQRTVDKRTTFLYNNKDSLILKTEFNERGNISRDTIIYDEKGRKTHRLSFYDTNKRSTYNKFKYNQNGKLIDRSTFNSDGTLQSRETYEYDEKEGLVMEHRHNSNDEISLTFISKYKTDGALLSREAHRKNGMEDKTTYTYDDKQCLLEEHYYNSNGELTQVIQYKYDDIGNRIEKKTIRWGEITELIKYEITYHQ
ncbi:hypothetical protein GCM10007415_42230 [Parapedobacter pyrenivorans]|uniref:YD repeat-containing protein n=2 Tax=Parapedobacter pyrenivorans TaxID=1305674 RepID=A0A917I0H8_9SPHI|nr:hypothetical protein GCM10007415_42230 [Parapedobacter pyrenivorans]